MASPETKIRLDFEHAAPIEPESLEVDASAARRRLEEASGPGKEFLGWLDLPARSLEANLLDAIESAAGRIRERDALVVVGIGGSYLGARAVIEALQTPFAPTFPIYYAGHQMDAAYHGGLLARLAEQDYAVNVISKSGTTTEPGLAFRLLWQDVSGKHDGAALKDRIFATTDAKKGSLRSLADAAGLTSFVIPDDVGGRFSVFSPVGLLPIAVAGIDVRALLAGAREMQEMLRSEAGANFAESPALQYAAYRNACYRLGKKIEIMAGYQTAWTFVMEWWKQLYGESEGKEGRGIFPASVNLSTDLHSMGQWIQDAERTIFETVIDVVHQEGPSVPARSDDEDGLGYLAGRPLHEINRTALKATMAAHHEGGVPCARLELQQLNAPTMGALLYFFEYACGISAYMLDVNPFDQPGVEAYKSSMFRLLGKTGHG